MSYTPTTWAAGDTVTAAKLNKLEQGVASSGVLVVNITWADGTATCDKTASEMFTAYRNGGVNLIEEGEDWGNVCSIVYAEFEDGEYSFYVENPTNTKWVFFADSGSDHPSYTSADSGFDHAS